MIERILKRIVTGDGSGWKRRLVRIEENAMEKSELIGGGLLERNRGGRRFSLKVQGLDRSEPETGPEDISGSPVLIREVILNHKEERLAPPRLRFVMLGLSTTSSCGRAHATTLRALLAELTARGHEVLCLELDGPGNSAKREIPLKRFGRVALYKNLRELKDRYAAVIRNADVTMLLSGVAAGAAIGEWVTSQASGVTAFYDLDTPTSIASLEKGDQEYLPRKLVAKYDLYLSFTGGPGLHRIQKFYGTRMARPLYCSVDPALYYPEERQKKWDFGYLGAYTEDCQPGLDELLLEPARNWSEGRFVVAGRQYPRSIHWPKNVQRCPQLAAEKRRAFYNAQRFTLGVARTEVVDGVYSPGARLFEAAACGTPIISDWWDGLDTFFKPNEEILISMDSEESLYYLLGLSEEERRQMGLRARARVLSAHTPRQRALELEGYVLDLLKPA